MSKTAILFPGQGSQTQNMGKELYDTHDCVKDLFKLGSKILGRDLAALCFETDNATLSETINSQPAIFTVSMAMLEVYKRSGKAYDGVLGFSLGEVAALVAADSLTLTDGFIVINKRANLMQEASHNSSGTMAAIIGLPNAAVEKVCETCSGYVIPVNYNCPNQLVIAGEVTAVDEAIAKCIELKAMKAVKLSVGAAFHSKLMQNAANSLELQTKGIDCASPTCEFYSNVTSDIMKKIDVPSYLKTQMVSPVLFEKAINKMIENGYTTFIELGSGKVLSGLVKRISREVVLG